MNECFYVWLYVCVVIIITCMQITTKKMPCIVLTCDWLNQKGEDKNIRITHAHYQIYKKNFNY